MTLSKRLSAVYKLVPEGASFIDIGTDHAFLPVKLLKDNRVVSAAAADINRMPLESARRTAENHGVKLPLFLSDGFDNVNFEYNTAAICGMGGMLIADILKRENGKKDNIYILQPMSCEEKLRAFLWTNGFEISDECHCLDAGKYYVVMLCKKTGVNSSFTQAELYTGKLCSDSEEAAGYYRKILKRVRKMSYGAQCRGSEALYLKEAAAELERRVERVKKKNGI